MGLIAYTTPKGLDREIDFIQNRVYDYLVTKKGWASYYCYPRAYVHKKGDKNTIEYSVNSKDYQDVLFDDKVYANSFFVLTKSDKASLRTEKAALSLVFQVNLKKIKSTVVAHVPDEDVINEISQILFRLPYSIRLTSVKRGVNEVYSDLGVNMSTRSEMSEYMVCRFDLDVFYTLPEPGTLTNQILN